MHQLLLLEDILYATISKHVVVYRVHTIHYVMDVSNRHTHTMPPPVIRERKCHNFSIYLLYGTFNIHTHFMPIIV